jgi:amidophosphoribosyltransferase
MPVFSVAAQPIRPEGGGGQVAAPSRVTPFNYGVDDDANNHPREECGLVVVVGDPTAPSLWYLSLQKLQHHGEESVGIVAMDGDVKLKPVTGLSLMVCGPALLASLSSSAAIEHALEGSRREGLRLEGGAPRRHR